MRRSVIIMIALSALLGCTLGQDYRRPAIDMPQAWRFEEKEARRLANTAWWEQFQDPVLNDLIQTALKENKDLQIATARMHEFMGRYGVTRADRLPQIGLDGTAGRQQVSQEGATAMPADVSPTYNHFQFTVSARWEIDFWGKLKQATEAARADLLATEEAQRAIILTLSANVANAYIGLLSLDQQLDIAVRTVKTRQESLDLFKLRFDGGLVSELELNQVQSEYEQARATIPFLENTIAQQETALNLLLGRNPVPIPRGKTMQEISLPAIPAGLPSELLEKRPDIRQAEQDLMAAHARIGVARAAYFPSISLTGAMGYASTDLSRLFVGTAGMWSYAGTMVQPIFTGGRLAGQVKVAEAVKEQMLFRYRQTIQSAFGEVENALSDQRKSAEKLAVETKQVGALKNYRSLAQLRYENGYSTYLEVLDADRSLFNAELTRTQTLGNRFRALINLYKAMGGGWTVAPE